MTRCCANAACSRAVGVSLEMSVDWLGQNPALPTPSIVRRTYACHGARTSGSSPKPAACRRSPEPSTRRAPTRSMIGPIASPVTAARPTRLRSRFRPSRCRSRVRCAGRSRGTGRRRRFRTSSSRRRPEAARRAAEAAGSGCGGTRARAPEAIERQSWLSRAQPTVVSTGSVFSARASSSASIACRRSTIAALSSSIRFGPSRASTASA